MGSGLDVKIFLLLQAAGVEQGVASSGWCFLPPLVQSLSDRFLMRHRIPLRIDFYVRQRVENIRVVGFATGVPFSSKPSAIVSSPFQEYCLRKFHRRGKWAVWQKGSE